MRLKLHAIEGERKKTAKKTGQLPFNTARQTSNDQLSDDLTDMDCTTSDDETTAEFLAKL